MRASVLVLILALTYLPASASASDAASDAVLREPYEVGADYAFESPVPECADQHVACFALTGSEPAIHLSIVDFQALVLPASAPIAAHVLATGPSGFTTGYLCGEGRIDFGAPRTFVRVEVALGGVGECTWSSEEDVLAGVVAGAPTRGEVILKTLAADARAADAALASPGCTKLGPALVCSFVGADAQMTGALVDAYVGDASAGAGAVHGMGFFGPLTIVDVHGGYGEYGWHAGAGASDYTFDDVPESTCVCAGAWSYQTGYFAIVSAGTFESTGDGPSVDDTFLVAGAGGAGVVYGWESGAPYAVIVTP